MGTEKHPVDESLLARWIPLYGEMAAFARSDEAPEELKNLYMEFEQSGSATLNRVFGASGMDLAQLPDVDSSMLTEPGFVTKLGGVRILNLQEHLGDGKERKYRFYRYAADDQFLRIWPVVKDLFRHNDETIQFDDPNRLQAYARDRVNREGFFREKFELYVRADASVTADDLYSKGDTEYRNGNYTQALPWLTAAADRGSSSAQRRMGNIYLSDDKGISPDTAKAVMYYERAARQGDKLSQSHLADLLYEGYWTNEAGVKSFYRDPRQAINWWMKASDKGLLQADHALAKAFLQGRGIQRDLHRARRHAVRWASLSDPDRKYGKQRLAELIDYEIQRQVQGIPVSEIKCSDFNSWVVPDEELHLSGGLKGLWEQIRYPDLARRADIEGTVQVRLHIGPTGKVTSARVSQGVWAQLDQEALRVARTAEFTPPPTLYGIPICLKNHFIPIKFDLSTASQKTVQDVNPASTVREAIQSVKASSRPSLIDQRTKVLILRNNGRESVRFRLVCASTQGRRKSFTISLGPNGSTELGFLQGWEGNFTSGDSCVAYDGETSVWRVRF
jgi:TonB family protein